MFKTAQKELVASPVSLRPLRIAMVAPPWFEIPPVGYGGTESVVGNLVNGLVERGHHVTLIASGRHRTGAQEFLQIYEKPPSELLGDPIPEMIVAVEVERYLRELDVDVVHDHSLAGPLHARYRDVPTVVTMHGPVDGRNGDYYARLGLDVHAVAISAAQRRLNTRIHWASTVHNAVDVASFTANAAKEDFVLWLGRFNQEKAPQIAIDAAKSLGRRIVLAGKRNEVPEKEFFDREVAPRLGRNVEYVGEADAMLKRELLAKAAVLAFPIQWEEPFGIVMAEALASGTPIAAFNRGSVPEVVTQGKTGVIVDDISEFPRALEEALALDSAACRADALARFDTPVMAEGYVRTYKAVANRAAIGTRAPAAKLGASPLPVDEAQLA